MTRRTPSLSPTPRIVAAMVPVLFLVATMPMSVSAHHVSDPGEPTESYGYIGYGIGDHTIDCGGAGNRMLASGGLPGVNTVRYEDGCLGGVMSGWISSSPPEIPEHWTVWAVDGTYEGPRRASWGDVDIVPAMFARMTLTAGTGGFSHECLVSDTNQPDPPADVCHGERPQELYSKTLAQFSVCGKGSVEGMDTQAWYDVQAIANDDGETVDWYAITYAVFVDGPQYTPIDCGIGSDPVSGVYDDAACWVNDREWEDCGSLETLPPSGEFPCSEDAPTSALIGTTCIRRLGGGASHCWTEGSWYEGPYTEDHFGAMPGTTGRIYWHHGESGCYEPTSHTPWTRTKTSQQSTVGVKQPVPIPGVPVGQISGIPTGQFDSDGDGLGDSWAGDWHRLAGQIIKGPDDLDGDGLENLKEFRWELVPVCPASPADVFQNCLDYESSPSNGTGGDMWNDGDEVAYWNNEDNDELVTAGYALFDPDRLLDSDGDGIRNTWDADADDDGWVDGIEVSDTHQYYTFPELDDSDCSTTATTCTSSADVSNMHEARVGDPGTGDGINDSAEYAAWSAYGSSAWSTDWDGDGITNNLLDPDSDNDGLLDGDEFAIGARPHDVDTDNDGLLDGPEVHTYGTDPLDWDTDGDGMPDGWEVENNLAPLVEDGAIDHDSDGLQSVEEYRVGRPSTWSEPADGPWDGGTNPNDADTEGDALTDGAEVLTHGTDPHDWDTDGDDLPDAWEIRYGFDPFTADAGDDPDQDFFDQGNDGSIEQEWTNLHEYRYGRDASWDEASQGPWMGGGDGLGTDPTNPDTDGDGAIDGQEAYFGTPAKVPAEQTSDDDGDGLSWAEEANLGTNPNDPDTDGDGLCDGGRAAACTWPGGDGTGFQPGEQDYGSTAWIEDSDGDGHLDGNEARYWDPQATGDDRDPDGDFMGGVIDSDSDNDGLTDYDERVTYGTDPGNRDTDGDTIIDGREVDHYGTDPLDMDTDGDGLLDSEELDPKPGDERTSPLDPDSDNDGLSDFEEIRIHDTNPNWWDTDHDQMPDKWEVDMGTSPKTDDALVDADGDGLVHLDEYLYDSHPLMTDTDSDGMPDGYEVEHSFAPSWSGDASLDADADHLSNLEEYQLETLPRDSDTDKDGLMDGDEVVNQNGAEHGTHPLVFDTDGDDLGDGAEVNGVSITVHLQNGPSTYTATSDPLVLDTDGDGDEDGAEVTQYRTDPRKQDTDGDSLLDHEETNELQGMYSAVMWDTDGDGESDGLEEAILCTDCDDDRDGLKNNDEYTKYGTDLLDGDSDNDGICDGSEHGYWGEQRWSHDWDGDGIINLLDPDSDNDGLSDGFEVGQGAYPNAAGGYKTDPLNGDTDGDTLGDAIEERIVEDADCPLNNDGGASSQSSSSMPGLPGVGLGPLDVLLVPLTPTALTGLDWNQVIEDAQHGVLVGFDEKGPYVQGAFGVRLRGFQFPDGTMWGTNPLTGLPALVPVPSPGPMTMSSSSSSVPDCPVKGKPTLKNTDGGLVNWDRLSDLQEAQYCLDPKNGDTDGDGIRDDRDGGFRWNEDTDGDGLINAKDTDSDSDGLPDGVEDKDRNGWFTNADLSDPLDGDTDDDGLLDGNEAAVGTIATKPDSDKDGLSDGLEVGLRSPQLDALGNAWTQFDQGLIKCGSTWIRNTWQPFQGTNGFTTAQGDADSDDDGIIDGLEDLNQNGVFGDNGELDPTVSDTDGDDLKDGLELLIYGDKRSDGSFTYSLCSIHKAWGSESNWGDHLEYDPGNKFQTNPRSINTDSGTDNVPDGKDLHPTGDALMSFGFGAYQSLDPIDPAEDCAWEWCGGPDKHKWQVDLSISVTLETPAGTYSFATEEIKDWYTENERTFNDLPSGETLTLVDEQTKPTAVIGRFDVVSQAVQLNLPDNVDDMTSSGTGITVTLGALDVDANFDNVIDISSKLNENAFVETIDLTSGPRDGKGLTGWEFTANGGADGSGKDDGKFKATFGANVMPYFLENTMALQDTNGELAPPSGTCLGGETASGYACVK